MTRAHRPVRRRKVFYIPGYDPFHPRRYRELYRREGAAQARLSGYDLTVARGTHAQGWHVAARVEGRPVEAEFEVLVWSDIVQGSMDRSVPSTYVAMARTAWIYLSTGTLRRLARLRKGPVVAALYPVAMLTLQLCLAAALALAVFRAATWASGGGLVPAAVASFLAFLAGGGLLRLFRHWDRHLYAHYLMLDYAFAARGRGRTPRALRDRIDAFATRVAAAADEDWDEILVVGHSSGAQIGVELLARCLRDGLPPGRVAFLTLGQVIPMVSFLPDAHALRADLGTLAAQDAVPWIDVTAPGDGCAFALCDPVAVSGVAPHDQRWPRILSAAFTRTLTPGTRARLRGRWFRLHFQYLCAFDALGDAPDAYDYFRVTAGPLTLADRFAGRSHSPQRLARPVSGHTGTAA